MKVENLRVAVLAAKYYHLILPPNIATKYYHQTLPIITKYYHLTLKVENLRVAVLAAKAYTALALGDYIPAGSFASDLLARLVLDYS